MQLKLLHNSHPVRLSWCYCHLAPMHPKVGLSPWGGGALSASGVFPQEEHDAHVDGFFSRILWVWEAVLKGQEDTGQCRSAYTIFFSHFIAKFGVRLSGHMVGSFCFHSPVETDGLWK